MVGARQLYLGKVVDEFDYVTIVIKGNMGRIICCRCWGDSAVFVFVTEIAILLEFLFINLIVVHDLQDLLKLFHEVFIVRRFLAFQEELNKSFRIGFGKRSSMIHNTKPLTPTDVDKNLSQCFSMSLSADSLQTSRSTSLHYSSSTLRSTLLKQWSTLDSQHRNWPDNHGVFNFAATTLPALSSDNKCSSWDFRFCEGFVIVGLKKQCTTRTPSSLIPSMTSSRLQTAWNTRSRYLTDHILFSSIQVNFGPPQRPRLV